MKTFVMLMLLVFSSSVAMADTLTLTFPSNEAAKVLDGITKGERACQAAELKVDCAIRLLIRHIQNECRNWENQVAEEAKAAYVSAALS